MKGTFHLGASVFVVRDNKVLLGKRKGSYGAGQWGLPGGHVELNEVLEEAARRELFEETGISVSGLEFVNTVNQPNRNEQDRHYVQFAFRAVDPVGEPENREPDECEGWEWFDFKNLPSELFAPHKKHIELFINGGHFAEEVDIV